MATYAIGDIHGDIDALDDLLDRLTARGPIDRLWFVGDLVNRGPDSAAVLRRVRGLGEQAITVLGNHDLALLSLVHRPDGREKADKSLTDLLHASDREELLRWLRERPLIHTDDALGWTMVHAGMPPEWDLAAATTHARTLEAALRGPAHPQILAKLLGNTPEHWSDDLSGMPRIRYIANALTRIRFVDVDGRLDMKYKKTIADAPAGLRPWFQVAGRQSAGQRIVFGHWSALDAVVWPESRVYGIDTGAAWGGPLTALQLDAADDVFIEAPAA